MTFTRPKEYVSSFDFLVTCTIHRLVTCSMSVVGFAQCLCARDNTVVACSLYSALVFLTLAGHGWFWMQSKRHIIYCLNTHAQRLHGNSIGNWNGMEMAISVAQPCIINRTETFLGSLLYLPTSWIINTFLREAWKWNLSYFIWVTWTHKTLKTYEL